MALDRIDNIVRFKIRTSFRILLFGTPVMDVVLGRLFGGNCRHYMLASNFILYLTASKPEGLAVFFVAALLVASFVAVSVLLAVNRRRVVRRNNASLQDDIGVGMN